MNSNNINSNYEKVLRITAWILRFNCSLKGVKTQKTINESILKPKHCAKGSRAKGSRKIVSESQPFRILFN